MLSGSKGIVHPYYVSALAPGAAAMAAAGALAFAKLASGQRRILGIVLALAAIAATIAVQIVLMHQQRYMEWFIPFLIAGGAVSWLVLALSRRLAAPAAAVELPGDARHAGGVCEHELARAGRGHLPGGRPPPQRRRRRHTASHQGTSPSTGR